MNKSRLIVDNIIRELFQSFPIFKNKSNYESHELLPYNVVGDFALDFQSDFIASQLTSIEIDNFFDFANRMVNSSDIEVQNIFVVEILEIFSDRAETIKLAREKLCNKGKELLEKTLRGWR